MSYILMAIVRVIMVFFYAAFAISFHNIGAFIFYASFALFWFITLYIDIFKGFKKLKEQRIAVDKWIHEEYID